MLNVDLEVARDLLTKGVLPIGASERIPLTAALGRILSEEIVANIDQPPFNRSPLDGIALSAQDVEKATVEAPITLSIIGCVYAGQAFSRHIGSGEAVRIMTGAPMPEGSNAVIKQEDVLFREQEVVVSEAIKPYTNYCFKGEDIEKGSKVLSAGEKLDAITIGILASLGVEQVTVYKKIKVGLFCTGDELKQIGEPLAVGEIYNANLYTLSMRLKELGIEAIIYDQVRDEIADIVQQIKMALEEVDVLITTGGVSVGERDQLHQVIKELPAQRIFWRVNMQPGTPMLAARYNNKTIVALSGNPFAALATFELLVRSLLAYLSRDKSLQVEEANAELVTAFHKHSGKRRFIRGLYEKGKVTLPNGHASGVMRSMKGCNCLIDIPAGTRALEVGDKIAVVLL